MLSPQMLVTVLAALLVSLGQCGVSESPMPGCDNGKMSLDNDLPAGAVYWDCPGPTWPVSTQTLRSIDTVYDPEPAKQICMDKPISYNHTIPSSGAYRPVMAESGEYLYCPPQRWLNNLHHGVTVLLYHPCAPLHGRLFLTVLARSCLPDYIITPHPQLNKHTPLALVSWGRTLELSTVTTPDVCVWLEKTTTTGIKFDAVNQSRNYNLLLTWPAEQHQQRRTHPEENSTKMKESLRQCCQRTISSLLNGAMETESVMKREGLNQVKEEAKHRHIRAAISKTKGNMKNENESSMTREVHNYNDTHGLSANPPPRSRTNSDLPGPKEAHSQFKSHNLNQGITPRPTTPLRLSTFRSDSLGVDASDSRKTNLNTEASTYKSIAGGTDSAKRRDRVPHKHIMKKNIYKGDKDVAADGKIRDNEVIEVKEREVEHKQTNSDTHTLHKSENTGSDSVSKSQLRSLPQPQLPMNTKADIYLPNRPDCEGCKASEHCECTKRTGDEARAAVVKNGLPRTPRTDEAVWAAAALGFLLVLLTLSVLHTRLYRHWRTMPSLYWHDPRQDYDSVADVIRRRLRIAKRRRKSGRRQEYVLLPSSSSSDEHP